MPRDRHAGGVGAARYSLLCQNTRRLFDAYHWLAGEQLAGLAPLLREIAATAELVLDEYEKVESIHKQSAQAMVDAESHHKTLLDGLLPDSWDQAQSFVDGLNGITAQRGLLLTIREYRYIDLLRLDAMEAELLAAQERVGRYRQLPRRADRAAAAVRGAPAGPG